MQDEAITPKAKNTRRAERMRAFQVLYSLCFNPVDSRRALMRAFLERPGATDDEKTPEATTVAVKKSAKKGAGKNADKDPKEAAEIQNPEGFAWQLTEGVWRNEAELDARIEKFSQNWRLERLGKVELTILRLCLYELSFHPGTPPKVIINEGLELSKQFGDEKSRSFINGILDAAIKKLP